MSRLEQPACTACAKIQDPGAPLPLESSKMLVCSRCQKQAGRQVHYCSRDCQVSDYPQHKSTCGLRLRVLPETLPPVADPSAPFQPPPALLFHLAALTTLPPPALPNSPPPSFLYFPSSPAASATSSSTSFVSRPEPVPVSLPSATRALFNAIQLVAFRTGNPLSVNLMYSLLVTEVEALGGADDRLVDQLAEEYRLDGVQRLGDGLERKSLRQLLKEEDEPAPQELVQAIGGEENMGLLLQWQMQMADQSQLGNKK